MEMETAMIPSNLLEADTSLRKWICVFGAKHLLTSISKVFKNMGATYLLQLGIELRRISSSRNFPIRMRK